MVSLYLTVIAILYKIVKQNRFPFKRNSVAISQRELSDVEMLVKNFSSLFGPSTTVPFVPGRNL